MKKKNVTSKVQGCSSLNCRSGYIIFDDDTPPLPTCVDGGVDCINCIIAEADISDVHDKHLQKATTKIKKILSDIPPHAKGWKLSFIRTKYGVLLAWLDHGATVPDGAEVLTQESDEKAFLKMLKIKKTKK